MTIQEKLDDFATFFDLYVERRNKNNNELKMKPSEYPKILFKELIEQYFIWINVKVDKILLESILDYIDANDPIGPILINYDGTNVGSEIIDYESEYTVNIKRGIRYLKQYFQYDYKIEFTGKHNFTMVFNMVDIFNHIQMSLIPIKRMYEELKKFRPGSVSENLEVYREIIAMQKYLEAHSEFSISTSEASICKAHEILPDTFNKFKRRHPDIYWQIRNDINEKDFLKVQAKLKEKK